MPEVRNGGLVVAGFTTQTKKVSHSSWTRRGSLRAIHVEVSIHLWQGPETAQGDYDDNVY